MQTLWITLLAYLVLPDLGVMHLKWTAFWGGTAATVGAREHRAGGSTDRLPESAGASSGSHSHIGVTFVSVCFNTTGCGLVLAFTAFFQ